MEGRTTERQRRRRLAAWLGFVLVIAALGYASLASDANSEVPDDFVYTYTATIAGIAQFAVFLGVLLLIVIGLPKREMFGLHRPHSWPRAIGYMVAGLIAIFVVGGALSPFLDAGEEQGIVPEEWDPDRAGAFIAFAVVAAVVAPVVEELMFRGVGFALLSPYGAWIAIITTGVLFGAYHGLLVALPVLATFGIVLGWLRHATGSVYPCIALHAIFNGVAIVSVPLFA